MQIEVNLFDCIFNKLLQLNQMIYIFNCCQDQDLPVMFEINQGRFQLKVRPGIF